MASHSGYCSSLGDKPHKRFNILSGEYLLCSPHRAKRPWDGDEATIDKSVKPTFDAKCYLCPGNTRVSGKTNENYSSTFVFDNDFSALLPHSENKPQEVCSGLLKATTTSGQCRVICFTPNHSLSIARMSVNQIEKIIETWIEQHLQLSKDFQYVEIFENRGAMMGCSNPHPHGQIWATSHIPQKIDSTLSRFMGYKKQQITQHSHFSCLLCQYIKDELANQSSTSKDVFHANRIVIGDNPDFVVLVPFWAYWPFEVLIIPRRHISNIDELTEKEITSLSLAMKQTTVKYDNLFKTPFPYSMGVQQSPTPSKNHGNKAFHMYIQYLPPLLRNASVKKFEVGYELFAERCRDITAEQAADRLRALNINHYLN